MTLLGYKYYLCLPLHMKLYGSLLQILGLDFKADLQNIYKKYFDHKALMSYQITLTGKVRSPLYFYLAMVVCIIANCISKSFTLEFIIELLVIHGFFNVVTPIACRSTLSYGIKEYYEVYDEIQKEDQFELNYHILSIYTC